jgi:hypothetical protein
MCVLLLADVRSELTRTHVLHHFRLRTTVQDSYLLVGAALQSANHATDRSPLSSRKTVATAAMESNEGESTRGQQLVCLLRGGIILLYSLFGSTRLD